MRMLLLKNRMVILPLIALIVGAAGGWKVTAEYYTGKIAKADRERLMDVVAAQNDVAEKVAAQQKKTVEVSDGYEKRIADLRGAYDVEFERLRNEAAAAGDLPAVADPAIKHHAAACPAGLSARTKERLIRIAQQADEQTARLVACQAWVRRQTEK